MNKILEALVRPDGRSALVVAVLTALVLVATAAGVAAQTAGGDLGGGADIFRPKNPTTKRKPGTTRPTRPRPPKPTLSPAERAERYEDALDDGNKARDERRYPDAEKAYRTAAALLPKDARAPYGLGNIYVDQQRWDDAEQAYRDAMGSGQFSAEVLIALSFVLVQPHGGGMLAQRLAESERYAIRATQLDPASAIAYDRVGAARQARGILDAETEQAFRKAVELDSQFAVAHAHLAILLRKTKRVPESQAEQRRAVELAQDAPTLVLIAEGLQSDSLYGESQPLLNRALELDAKYPPAYYLLGKSYLVTRDLTQTEAILKRGLEVSPRSFPLTFLLARTYLVATRLEEAERTFGTAAGLAPVSDRKQVAGEAGLAGVGDAYMRAGRSKDALRVYQRAAELDPGNTAIAAKIASARAGGN
ncbi:MAG: tetratricopeptide repeat protein [Pyrinomonadaceae bacterium]